MEQQVLSIPKIRQQGHTLSHLVRFMQTVGLTPEEINQKLIEYGLKGKSE